MARRNRKNPRRRRLVAALKRKLLRTYPADRKGCWAELRDDIFIMSLSIFDFLTPSQKLSTILLVTPALTLVTMIVFAFMAGAYSFYLNEGQNDTMSSIEWGPNELLKMAGITGVRFNLNYLLAWGGKYLPLIRKGETYRWFSSLLVHRSFMHVTANCLMFVMLSSYLEYCYGVFRLALVIFLAALGGNLLSGLLDSQCSIGVGSSGVIFGLIGFTAAHYLFSCHLKMSKIKLFLLALIATVFFSMTIVLEEFNSHITHLGGFFFGVVPSLLFMKDLKHELVEVGVLWGGVGILILFFSIVPIVLLRYVPIDVACPHLVA